MKSYMPGLDRRIGNFSAGAVTNNINQVTPPKRYSLGKSFVIWNLLGGIGWAVIIGLVYLFLHVIGVVS